MNSFLMNHLMFSKSPQSNFYSRDKKKTFMGSFQVWTQQETSQFGQKDERKILIELSFLD